MCQVLLCQWYNQHDQYLTPKGGNKHNALLTIFHTSSCVISSYAKHIRCVIFYDLLGGKWTKSWQHTDENIIIIDYFKK